MFFEDRIRFYGVEIVFVLDYLYFGKIVYRDFKVKKKSNENWFFVEIVGINEVIIKLYSFEISI